MTVIGIDFGTANSCVEIFHNNKIEIITNENGNRLTPSIVSFTDEGILIGDSAKDQMMQNPTNTIYDIKFFLGRKYTDTEIQSCKAKYPFKIIPDQLNRIQFEVQLKGQTTLFYPEEVAAILLSKLNQDAEKYLSKKVTGVVISVPAFFVNKQRQAVLAAASMANLNVLRLVNETTAAALIYSFEEKSDDERLTLFVDVGRRKTDVTLINIEYLFIEPLATSGNTVLGGQSFNDQLFNYTINFLRERCPNLNVFESPEQIEILNDLIEKAKIELSMKTTVDFEFNDMKIEISRELFNQLNEEFYRSIIKNIEDVLKSSEKTKGDVVDIVLTGGSSEIPQIQKTIEDYFGKKIHDLSSEKDEIVAIGAAIDAAIVTKQLDDFLIVDIIPAGIGIERSADIMCFRIKRNSMIPGRTYYGCSTYMNDQKVIRLDIFEGFSDNIRKNDLVETTIIANIPLAERGVPQIEIAFNVDENGIFNSTAKATMEGKPINDIVVKHEKKTAFSEYDIERMRKKLISFLSE